MPVKKYNKQIIRKIEEGIKSGLSDKMVCDLVGINRDTFYTWIKEKKFFSDRIKRARAIKCKLFAEMIKMAGMGETEVVCPGCGKTVIVTIPQKQWQAIAWLAERTEFDEFGNKQRFEHTGKDGEPIAIKPEHWIEIIKEACGRTGKPKSDS